MVDTDAAWKRILVPLFLYVLPPLVDDAFLGFVVSRRLF